MARVGVIGSDTPKGDDYIVTVNIGDGRSWGYKSMQVDEAIGLIITGMLRWWKRQITQGFWK